MSSIFSGTYWPFVYLLQRNVCSEPLPISQPAYSPFYYWVARVLDVFWIQVSYQACEYTLDVSPLSDTWVSISCKWFVPSSILIASLPFTVNWPMNIYVTIYLNCVTFRLLTLVSAQCLSALCAEVKEAFQSWELPRVSDSEDHSDPRPSPSQGL